MDLPPDKAKLLKQYDDKRKWEIVCDQVINYLITFFSLFAIYNCLNSCISKLKELVQVRESPKSYIKKLQIYLDPKASRSIKVSII